MKIVRWAIVSLIVLAVIGCSIEFIRYSHYDIKKQIAEVNEDEILLAPLKIEPDAHYMLEKVQLTENTIIQGLGFSIFFVKDVQDLKHGQKVKVWLSDKENNAAERVVVYNFY
ncbi:hypothetical protein [Bacillus litorisediminis]|uniref:hypothetical protein n=1 Tax=Bacillus litorisediminis TaxID=2922713 RepID=UPI001FAD11DB|nr:hypothetical protein [Bacillus litorisediminis]